MTDMQMCAVAFLVLGYLCGVLSITGPLFLWVHRGMKG